MDPSALRPGDAVAAEREARRDRADRVLARHFSPEQSETIMGDERLVRLLLPILHSNGNDPAAVERLRASLVPKILTRKA